MKKIFSIFFLLLIHVIAFSQSSFDPAGLLAADAKKPDQLVNDYSNTLTADQRSALEYKLDTFDRRTSSQIAVVIVPSLGDYDIEDYAVRLGRKWGVGGKENNNGVMLVICTDPDNHKLNISTGYGMEGALPDITCKSIIDNEIVPNFKAKDYYGGIDAGIDAIIQATQGEYTAPQGYGQTKISIGKIILLIIIIIVLLSIFSGGGGGTFMSRRGFITPLFWGGFGGGSSGGSSGGWGGGGSGGGFGGFGGGSFGGGGASGSW